MRHFWIIIISGISFPISNVTEIIFYRKVIISDRNHLDEAVYVGDIQGDYDASRKAGVGFIHAAYGFGIVPEAQYKIQSFSELVTKRVAETYFRGLI